MLRRFRPIRNLSRRLTATCRNWHRRQLRRYADRTPLFWPRLSLYRDAGNPTFSPRALKITFLDGLVFLGVFSLIEDLEHLQTADYLPTLLWIY